MTRALKLQNSQPAPTGRFKPPAQCEPDRVAKIRAHTADLEARITCALFDGAVGEIVVDSSNGISVTIPGGDRAKLDLYRRMPDVSCLYTLESEIRAAPQADRPAIAAIVVAILRGRAGFREDGHVNFADAAITELSVEAARFRWTTLVVGIGVRRASNASRFLPEICEIVDACRNASAFIASALWRSENAAITRNELEFDLLCKGLLKLSDCEDDHD